MVNEILMAIVQAATEFLPVSSSGHLALLSNLISEPNLFLITVLHFASLFAVLIFTRREIYKLVTFQKNYRKMWLYLIIGTIPAALFGFFFKSSIESALSSYLFLGIAFLFTGFILLITKFVHNHAKLDLKNSVFIGLFQVLALFPGVSRSGMTISAGLFTGIKKSEAVKFSFLLFIPLVLGAMVLQIGNAYFSMTLLWAFLICFALSWVFLNLVYLLVEKNYFWVFSIYAFILGVVSLALWLG